MEDALDVLLHPARWAADAADLRPLTRIYLALLVVGVTVGAAAFAGWLTARWAHRRTQDTTSAQSERTILRLRRQLVALTYAIGLYLALEILPLPAKLDGVLTGIAFSLGAFLCARALIRLVALLVTSSLAHVNEHERHRIEREYVPLAEKVTTLAVAFIYVIVVAKHFGKDVSSLVAALGVGSLAIGLAAQQTLGNMIAGFVLLVDRPFRPGERIKLATGEVGEVRDIGVRSTRIRLLDGNLLVVPNSELANSRVVNFAVLTTHADIRILVGVGTDLERAVAILQSVAASDERARGVFVRVTGSSQHGIELTLGFDAATVGEAAVAEAELRQKALVKLRAEKIVLPDPYKSSQGVPSGSPV